MWSLKSRRASGSCRPHLDLPLLHCDKAHEGLVYPTLWPRFRRRYAKRTAQPAPWDQAFERYLHPPHTPNSNRWLEELAILFE